MAFREPFAAFNAVSNIEAHLVCGILNNAGIDAFVIEDISQVGVWLGGHVAEIHKPQVWIERADIDRAGPHLAEYDRRNAERRLQRSGDAESGEPIVVTCEDCGKLSEYPARRKGTVQNCLWCRAFVDVEDEVGSDDWKLEPGEEPAEAG